MDIARSDRDARAGRFVTHTVRHASVLVRRAALPALLTAAGLVLPMSCALAQLPAPAATEPARPQDPRAPIPYRAEEVRFANTAAGIQLAGTLTLPAGAGPHPAVVLISGSGPQNRDSETYDHRTFLVLADHLTRNEIAVLRSDDRGVGASGGVFDQATTEDFASDAAAALAYLRTRPEIRGDAVGLLGLSEGGLVAPLVATGPNPPAFLVLMGAPGLPGDEVLYQQSSLVARAMGLSESQINYNRQVQEQMFAVIEAEGDQAARLRRMEELLRGQFASLSPEERAATGLTREGEDDWIRSQLRTMGGPWFRYFLMHDPRPVLRQVRVPVLALGGTLDLQVPPDPNLSILESTLREAGNGDVTVVRFERLNHLFQPATTGVPAEYRDIPETMSPEVMARVASWILEKTRR
jgi:pimeloyl-ACP methyl ester carboxylesterase